MPNFYYYFSKQGPIKTLPNYWDGIAFILVFGIIGVIVWGTKQMGAPFQIGQTIPISLDPHNLPEYGLFTILRMLIAMCFSVLFTLTVATWAAKSKRAGQLIIPCIDILQSIPVLPMLAITVTGFIMLFPGSRLGPECASIFTVFLSQVWNMAFSFYQSLRTVPTDLKEAADMFHLSAWQRFWRIEVPFAMPGLLWNSMLSMSGSWFFVVISESIPINNQHIALPGIGSYLGMAIDQANLPAVGYAVLAMAVIILLYDQLLFRPLLSWAEKFKSEHTATDKATSSWITSLLKRTQVLTRLANLLSVFGDAIVNYRIFNVRPHYQHATINPRIAQTLNYAWYIALLVATITSATMLSHFVFASVSHYELLHVFVLGGYTALRVLVIVLISTIIWVPIGVWIGLRPKIAEIVQPIAQFLAAFPAYVLFPLVVIAIIRFKLNVEIWITPLMLLGTQWYILFNVIAGTSALPKDLKQVTENFGITGWQWWRKLALPGIFPYYITGAITAIGNAWNTSVVAEIASWGNTTLTATGLGAYITHNSNDGDFPRVALGMGVMCVFVLVMNRLVWRPLYNLAQTRYRLD